MVKGGDGLTRGRIPELGGFVFTCRENSSAVGTKGRVVDLILVVKGGEELAGGRVPELGAVVRTRRQNPRAVRTERCVVDRVLMGKGGHEACPSPYPRAWRSDPRSP